MVYVHCRSLHSFPTRRSSDLEGLIRDAMKSKMKLDIFDYERPVGIQIFGGDEEAMELSAKIVETVQPDLRSEEHTSELQSRENLVCRLLLEKKNVHLD